ncbi:hypothetical protein X777_02442, partial [Ooceraea biroi]
PFRALIRVKRSINRATDGRDTGKSIRRSSTSVEAAPYRREEDESLSCSGGEGKRMSIEI